MSDRNKYDAASDNVGREILPDTSVDGTEFKKGALYTRLSEMAKEIRLIKVLAGDNNDPVACTLEIAVLDTNSPPVYETVSYCWGNAQHRSIIAVNDLAVSVPASAAAALRRLRWPQAARVLWLDAICIDQDDFLERSRQVAIMGDIYRNGICNLIYLGENTPQAAMISVRAILHEAMADPTNFTKLRNDLGAWQYSSTRMTAEYDAAPLLDFFRNPWFRRLWVVQEAALAKKNICFSGLIEFDLLEVTRAAAWLIYNYYFVDADLRLECSYAADMNDLVDSTYGYHHAKAGHPAKALYLLDLSQQRLASVAVDKVYAILGLIASSDDSQILDIVPDYSKNAAEVFREAAWCLIKMSEDLQILDYVRHDLSFDGPELHGFPSWVPKWHKPKDNDQHPMFMSLSFNASSGRKAVVRTASNIRNPAVLNVEGVKIGKVQGTTGRYTTSLSSCVKKLDAFLDHAEEISRKCDPGNTALESPSLSIAITMVAGVDLHYKSVTSDVEMRYSALRQMLRQGCLPPEPSQVEEQEGQATIRAAQYREAMGNACNNRTFFHTESGHFGLGPHYMAEGDVAAILFGLQFPVILRPIGETCIFLGTAYVHYLMHGEGVVQDGTAGVSNHSFSIQ